MTPAARTHENTPHFDGVLTTGSAGDVTGLDGSLVKILVSNQTSKSSRAQFEEMWI